MKVIIHSFRSLKWWMKRNEIFGWYTIIDWPEIVCAPKIAGYVILLIIQSILLRIVYESFMKMKKTWQPFIIRMKMRLLQYAYVLMHINLTIWNKKKRHQSKKKNNRHSFEFYLLFFLTSCRRNSLSFIYGESAGDNDGVWNEKYQMFYVTKHTLGMCPFIISTLFEWSISIKFGMRQPTWQPTHISQI